MEENYEKHIEKWIARFQVSRKVNLSAFFYRAASDSLGMKWLYIVVPLVIYTLNLLLMMKSGVLYSSENNYAYINDTSNSLGLSLLYFISYFVSAYFPEKFDEWIDNGIEKEYFEKKIECIIKPNEYTWKVCFFAIVLVVFSYLSGYLFYYNAAKNENMFWIRNLSAFGRLYYRVFLALTWYHSLSLLGMALSAGFSIYWSIKAKKIIYIEKDFNKNISIIKMVDILISIFSYGVFYIIVSVLFILSDRISKIRFGIYNTFSRDEASFLLILCVLSIVALVYVPLQELIRFMKLEKDKLIQELNAEIENAQVLQEKRDLIEKRNNIITDGLIYTSFTNKLVIMLSIIVPLAGVILQGAGLILDSIRR